MTTQTPRSTSVSPKSAIAVSILGFAMAGLYVWLAWKTDWKATSTFIPIAGIGVTLALVSIVRAARSTPTSRGDYAVVIGLGLAAAFGLVNAFFFPDSTLTPVPTSGWQVSLTVVATAVAAIITAYASSEHGRKLVDSGTPSESSTAPTKSSKEELDDQPPRNGAAKPAAVIVAFFAGWIIGRRR
jgi:hypothetical protein